MKISRSFFVKNASRLWHNSTQQVMSITAVGMILALLADVLIAARLGATAIADTLIIALTLPRLIEVVAREGTKFSLVSLLVEVEQKKTQEDFYRFVSVLFNIGVVAGILILILGWLLAPPLIQLTGPGLASSAKEQAIELFWISLPLSFFAILATVLGVFLNSQKHFAVTAARNMSMPSAIIILTLINWQNSEIVFWIAIAHSVGYFVYFACLLIYSNRKTQLKLSIRDWPDRATISQLKEAVIYPTLGLTVRQSLRIIERALASLVAPGGVSAYYFAFRLISSVQTIIGVSLATTKLPSMSRMVSQGKSLGFGKSLLRQMWQIAIISLPITMIVLGFHTHIIQILYGRGAFNEGSVAQTSQILQALGFGIFFLTLIPTLNAALYALQRYKLVWWNQVFNTAVNLILAWWLSQRLGLVGIAIAVVAASVGSTIVQIIMLRYSQLNDFAGEV